MDVDRGKSSEGKQQLVVFRTKVFAIVTVRSEVSGPGLWTGRGAGGLPSPWRRPGLSKCLILYGLASLVLRRGWGWGGGAAAAATADLMSGVLVFGSKSEATSGFNFLNMLWFPVWRLCDSMSDRNSTGSATAGKRPRCFALLRQLPLPCAVCLLRFRQSLGAV